MFLVALTCLALLAGQLAPTADAKPRKIKRCNGQAALCPVPFNEVVLPGSHNAMSSADLGWRIPNQTLDIPGQLEAGVRALLIDTYYGIEGGDGVITNAQKGDPGAKTYLCHVLCQIGASRLAPTLRQIRRYLRSHRSTVLLIEVEDYIEAPDFARAVRRSGLIDFVYRGRTDRWPTLRRMIRSEQRVVMLSDNHGGQVPWYHPTYEGILQETPYSFDRPSMLIQPPNWPASCAPNRGGTNGTMFLMNHWSPPIPPNTPDLEESARVNDRAVLVGRAHTCAELRGRFPSIVAADQVTAGDLFGAVRDLNAMAAGRL